MPANITLTPETLAVFRSGVPLIMEQTGRTWEQAIEHMALAGFIAFHKQIAEELQKQSGSQSAIEDEAVEAAIAKLKSEFDTSVPELGLILRAAASGHPGAQIILSDFKRFGRSLNK
jgi:hypothetical protein